MALTTQGIAATGYSEQDTVGLEKVSVRSSSARKKGLFSPCSSSARAASLTEDAHTPTQLDPVLLLNVSFEYLSYKCDVPYDNIYTYMKCLHVLQMKTSTV